MAGSTEAFEAYYNKSIDQIKDDFREDIKDQLLAGRMRNKIVGELTVTPSEVRDFFFKIPSDSLPFFNTEFEVSQIVIDAQISDFQKEYARKTTTDLRDRLLAGESFELLASLYSQDPGSAENGGELGMVPRGTFVKEFDAAAYKLKKDEISEIVETQFGFHILQLIERRGDLINIRHILIKPKSVSADLIKARNILDTVKLKVLKLHKDSLTFLQAVNKYSEDELSKSAGGRLINKETGGTIIESKDMDPTVLFIVDTMQVGTISDPVPYMKEDGTQGYRILRLDSKTPPHKANLEQDYDKLQNATKSNKENEEILKWIRKNGRKSYIMVAPEYKNCSNLNNWLTN
jgi:peptidyl-prolyl cis-trans isomerase SurA